MIHHFFVEPSAIRKNTFSITNQELLHQLTKVLRVKTGEKLILLDDAGMEFEVEISQILPREISGKIIESRENKNEPLKNAILYQALPKKMPLFELVLQKCTEIGIKKFIPLVTEHTERRDFSNKERLLKILKGAAEQSQRGYIPQLENPIAFGNAIARIPKDCGLVFDASGVSFADVKNDLLQLNEIRIFIGPEGGFSKKELANAKNHGLKIISLGPRSLRTETAGMVCASLFILA